MSFRRDISCLFGGSRRPRSAATGKPGPGEGTGAGRPRAPLTRRIRPGYWTAADFAAGGLAGLSSGLTAGPAAATFPSRLVLAIVITVPVGLRRRHPLPGFFVLVILAALATTAGLAVLAGPTLFFAAAYVLYIVTAGRGRPVSLAALGAALAVIVATWALAAGHQIPASRDQSSGFAVFSLVIAWLIGNGVRQRRRYARMREHEAASSAIAGERLRIARELHDVVAHSMSVIAVQAGYGQHVIDSSPAGARQALGAIQATSRETLDELRRMLGVLREHEHQERQGQQGQQGAGPGREPAGPAPLAAAAGPGDLERLVASTRGAGVEVSLERTGRVRDVPGDVGLSAYRIVQEALTNVVRHAGHGARCTARLDYGETALHVQIMDDGGQPLIPAAGVPAVGVPAVGVPAAGVPAAPGPGHGLAGMRERAHLCGGEFTAGPLPDGGFQVSATLPLPGGQEGTGGLADGGPADGMPGGAS